MVNRGKGKKGGKKGSKGGKGAKLSNKWGDENVAREEEKPIKKKPRITQDFQDRERRMRLREFAKAKEHEKLERLSRPNHAVTVPRSAGQSSGRKRKRKRSMRSSLPMGRKRESSCHSSSDDENPMSWDKEAQSRGGFDVGLANYNKLLSTLTGSGAMISSLTEDKDLADAVMTRRMQTHGKDDAFGSEGSATDDEESADEDEDEDEDGGEPELDERKEQQQGINNEELVEKKSQRTPDANGVRGYDLERRSPPHGGDTEEETHVADESGDEAHEMMGANGDANLHEDDQADVLGTSVEGNRQSPDELGRHFISTPVFPPNKAKMMLSESARPSFKALVTARRKWEDLGFAVSASKNMGDVPGPLPSEPSLTQDLRVLPSLASHWEQCNNGPPSKIQSLMLPPMASYRDMVYCGWRDDDADDIRKSYALHALNHALTSRRRVLRHTARLRKTAEEARLAEALGSGKPKATGGDIPAVDTDAEKSEETRKADGNMKTDPSPTIHGESTASGDWQRDQGFTRPKVLILVPFRAVAYELVQSMLQLLGPKTVVANQDRFDEEYGPDKEDIDGSGEGDDERAQREKAVLERKPADWKALFGGGRNVDDMFTIGVSISPGGGKGKPGEGKGVGVRLYCDFYSSDIIIASPVALHRVAVPTAEGADGHDAEDVDSDFLSSVEVMILDRADVFLMQNWAYVPDIAEVVNARPNGERAGRVDFSRVRSLFLHDQGRLFRQTLVFSAYQDPNLNAFVSRHCRNHDGVLKIWRPSGDGHICSVALQAKQVFQRIPADSPAAQHEARFQYFVSTVLPQMVRAKQSHSAIFIPSYFDYVRLRNHLMKLKASVVSVHEYSRGSEVSRSRSRFFRGERDIMLYTGRAHFFNRHAIRGIHHLIFYSLPECPQFYPEMVNLLEEAGSTAAVTCLVLFTRFERLSLERIVGEERAQHMLGSPKNTFLFC